MKILVWTPEALDGTSYYRCWGVLANLNRLMGGKLEFVDYAQHFRANSTFGWRNLMDIDICFFHRPHPKVMLELAQYAKNMGKKIWIDFDDNLFELPIENPGHPNYTEAVKQTMFNILRAADVVTVSTQGLKTAFEKMGVWSCQIIPNAINDDLQDPAGKFNEAGNYFWRGSQTHHGDLYDFQQEIFDAYTHSKWPWFFFGFNPWFISRLCDPKTFIVIKGQDIMIYLQQVGQMKPHFSHVPLSDNVFNHCKSNIAWMEMTYAGAVCLAPDWEEWQRPGVINYTNPTEYRDKLITPPENLEKSWKESMDYIKTNLLLSKVNLQRKELLERLLDGEDSTDFPVPALVAHR